MVTRLVTKYLLPLRWQHWLLLFVATRFLFGIAYVLSDPWEQVPVAAEWYATAGTDGYIQLARTWLTTGEWAYFPQGATVHNRPPLHPLLLAITAAWDTQHWYLWWMLVAATLQLLAFALFRRLLVQLSASPVAVALCSLAFLLHPNLLSLNRASTFVPLALLLLLLFTWCYAHLLHSGQVRGAIYMGLCLGALLLTHGTFIVLLPLVLCLPSLRWPHRLGIAAVAMLLVLPWSVWNHSQHKTLIPVATGAGIQYWKGKAWLTQQPDLEYRVYREATGAPLRQTYFGPDDPADDALLLRLAATDIAAQPAAYALRSIQSYALFWLPNDRSLWKQALTACAHTLFVLLALYLRRSITPYTPSIHRKPVVLLTGALLVVIPLPFALLGAITGYFGMLLPIALLLVALLPACQKTTY